MRKHEVMAAPLAKAQNAKRIISAICFFHHVGDRPHFAIMAVMKTARRAGLCQTVLTIALRAPAARSLTTGSVSKEGLRTKARRRLMARLAALTLVCALGSSFMTFAKNAVAIVIEFTNFCLP